MGLEPGPKWAKFIFSNFLLHKNHEKNFENKIFTYEGEQRGEFFDEN